uniref:Pre-mRNA-processing factor 39 n=1 Tax=Petromyzon marinus TaxID=7757 RepID=A0AAJ7TQL6_PETMA|nr:pre-mRNA-processing factor 39 [Petromyzon marinus]
MAASDGGGFGTAGERDGAANPLHLSSSQDLANMQIDDYEQLDSVPKPSSTKLKLTENKVGADWSNGDSTTNHTFVSEEKQRPLVDYGVDMMDAAYDEQGSEFLAPVPKELAKAAEDGGHVLCPVEIIAKPTIASADNKQGSSLPVQNAPEGMTEIAGDKWDSVATQDKVPAETLSTEVNNVNAGSVLGQEECKVLPQVAETQGAAVVNAERNSTVGDSSFYDPEEEIPPFPPEFDKYWKAVEENPQDFTGWTYLLQYIEQENHVWAARKAFDEFFMRYPYCYGYWKKYADLEKRFGNVKQAEEVFRRGLQAIPLSVDLWIHYINFEIELLDPDCPETVSKIRSLFELAVAAAGTDFRSDKLWEMFISWERENIRLREVTAVYDMVLNIPTQLYSHHFDKFKEHVNNHQPKDILSTDEFLKLRAQLVSSRLEAGEQGVGGVEEDDEDVGVSSGGDAPPGIEGPPGDDQPPGMEVENVEVKVDAETEKLRERIIGTRQDIFFQNEQEVSKRWTFEEGIKRPYFHVKPLERAQLKNWKEYLDFEIDNGTHERVVVLFERCVIACALYEEFWIKYAKYMEEHSLEGVQNVFRRACMIHLPKKHNIHLLWAAFEEQQGNLDEARRVLRSLEESLPGLAMVRLRRVSLERRQGNFSAAETLLREAMEGAKTPEMASFYAIKLTRMLAKVEKTVEKARKVLLDAIEKDSMNTKIYLNLLELEFSGDIAVNEEHIMACFEKVQSSDLSMETKITFSQRKVEFLEDFSMDVKKLLAAYDEHQVLLRQHSTAKKRAPTENGAEEPEEKRFRLEEPVVAPVIAAHLNPAAAAAAAAAAPAPLPMQHPADPNVAQAAYNYSNWYQHYNYQNYPGSYQNYHNPWNYGQYYPPS